jgi:hypothetical protein
MVTMGTRDFNQPSKILEEIGIKIVLFPLAHEHLARDR